MRYIHMNPVRAGIVRRPEEYRWSSYRDYLGIRKCPKWLEVKQTLEMFGGSEKEQRKEYRDFVKNGERGNHLQEMSFGAILGTVQFIKRMREKLRSRKQEKGDSEIAGMLYPSRIGFRFSELDFTRTFDFCNLNEYQTGCPRIGILADFRAINPLITIPKISDFAFSDSLLICE